MNGQYAINVGAGIFGAFLTFAFGGWSEALTFLLVLIAADIISGIYAAIAEGHGLKSSVMRRGLANKGLIFLVIIVAHRIDVLLGTDVVMGGTIYFYAANELLSLIENYGRIGFPLPERLRSIVAVLKGRADNGDGK